jgi:hypothetical protein
MFRTNLARFTLSLFVFIALIAGVLFSPAFFTKDNVSDYALANENPASSTTIPWQTTNGIPHALYYSNTENSFFGLSNNDYVILSSEDSDDHSSWFNTMVTFRFGRDEHDTSKITGWTINASLSRGGQTRALAAEGTNQVVGGFLVYEYNIRMSEINMAYLDTPHIPIPFNERAGRYTFTINYSVSTGSQIIGPFVYTISFNVVDYADYGGPAFTISNAGPAIHNDANFTSPAPTDRANIYLYNFNQNENHFETNRPVLSFNATLFGVSYTRSIQTSATSATITPFNFVAFMPGMAQVAAARPEVEVGTQTGVVEIRSGSQTLLFPTFKASDILLYEARIEFNTLGDYTFNLELLDRDSFIAIPGVSHQLEDERVYLSMFGHQLNYRDQVTGQYLEMANNHTQANAITYLRHAGNLTQLPVNDTAFIYDGFRDNTAGPNRIKTSADIPVTNQAPIRFNHYGTLTSGRYATFTTKELALAFLNSVANAATQEALDGLDGQLRNTFVSGNRFNMNGIYVVKVSYQLRSAIPARLITVGTQSYHFEGHQYFIFQIDNRNPEVLVESVVGKTGTPLLGEFTNQNLRILMPVRNYTFNAPISATFRHRGLISGGVGGGLVLSPTPTSTGLLEFSSSTVYYGGDENTGILCNFFVMPVSSDADFTFPSSMNGVVFVDIEYGSNRVLYGVRYIIDSTDISGIALHKVLETPLIRNQFNKDSVIQQTPLAGALGRHDMTITSDMFSLSWNEKFWANLSWIQPNRPVSTATVYRLPINDLGNVEIEDILLQNNRGRGLTNGFETTSILELISYQNTKNRLNHDTLENLHTEQFISAAGIYLFYVEDLAGNFFYRMVMLDNTLATVMQHTLNDSGVWENSLDWVANPANFVKNDTRITFGTHKLIQVGEIAFDESEMFANHDGTFLDALMRTSLFASASATSHYIAVPLTQVQYRIFDENEEDWSDFANVTSSLSNVDSSLVGTTQTPWRLTIFATNTLHNPFVGEKRYEFDITATNNRTTKHMVEMNFDNAMGHFTAKNPTDSIARYIPTRTGTNFTILQFNFLDDDELVEGAGGELEGSIFAIADISYKLFPFDYTSPTSSYPFATAPLLEMTGLYPNLDSKPHIDTGFITLEILNSLELNSSLPGRYEFTRTYAGGPEVDYGLDSWQRHYIVYVDHNGVISNEYIPYDFTDNHDGMIRKVGENISVTLAAGIPGEEITFKNFFRNPAPDTDGTRHNVLLTTNKLPVRINIPLSKYFLRGEHRDFGSNLGFTRLTVELYRISGGSSIPRYYTIDRSAGGFWFSIDDLTEAGTYTLTIRDNTGFNDYSNPQNQLINEGAAVYRCNFVIEHNAPVGRFSVNGNELVENIGGTTFATNVGTDGLVEFDWVDPSDPYSAKVTEVEIRKFAPHPTNRNNPLHVNILTLKSEGDSFLINLATGANTFVTDGISLLRFDVEFVKDDFDVFEGIPYRQYKYTLRLNIEEEGEYDIILRYAASGTTHHFGDFNQRTYTLQIDRTKPMVNITQLLENDFYLIPSGYYTEDNLDEFKEEKAVLFNPASGGTPRPTIYDYTFAVDHSFTLTYDPRDTMPFFYFRKYNKYNNENRAGDDVDAHISITPDNPHYNNFTMFPRYPRFNANTYTGFVRNYNSSIPLAEMIRLAYFGPNSHISDVVGFFEIIERDLAGNYRAYTVYFGRNPQFDLLELQATDGTGSEIQGIHGPSFTANTRLNVSGYRAVLGWSHLNLQPEFPTPGINPVNLVLTPYDLAPRVAQNINALNLYFSPFVITTNSTHVITLTTPYTIPSIQTTRKTVGIQLTDQRLPAPTIIRHGDNAYDIQFPMFPADNRVLHMTRISVNNIRSYTNPLWTWTLPENTDPRDISLSDLRWSVPVETHGLGAYFVRYTDNFNGDYEYIAHVGVETVDDELKYRFVNGLSFEDQAGNLYAGNEVVVTYQSIIHPVIRLSINGGPANPITEESRPVSDYSSGFLAPRDRFRSFVLPKPAIEPNYSASENIGGRVTYTLHYFDMNNNKIDEQTIIIFNELPQIYLMDLNNPDLNLASNISHNTRAITNSPVNIVWGDLERANLPHPDIWKPVVTVFRVGGTSYSIEEGPHTIRAPGDYIIELRNELFGNFRTVTFNIREGALPFYTVHERFGETIGGALTASPRLLNIGDRAAVRELNVTGAQTTFPVLTRLENILGINTELRQRLDEADKNIRQYYSLNDTIVQLDGTRNLEYVTFTFYSGMFVPNPQNTPPGANDHVTTIYLIYGLIDPIFSEIIAVTRTPFRTSIVNSLNYERAGTTTPIRLEGFEHTLRNTDVINGPPRILWNTISNTIRDGLNPSFQWYNDGNVVMLDYSFGNNNSFGNIGNSSTNAITGAPLSWVNISGSGQHTLVFRDMAGNVAEFRRGAGGAASHSYYWLTILDQVIFRVNNATPVNHSVFNKPARDTDPDPVIITLDPTFLPFYSRDISVTIRRNGEFRWLEDHGTVNSFSFREPGRYEVTINARYRSTDANSIGDALTPAVYSFVIIDALSARLAYEWVNMRNYEITRVVKDEIDITDAVKNHYIRVALENPNAQISQTQRDAFRIVDFFASVTNEEFGNGRYTLTSSVTYNELLAPRVYSYSFMINNNTPPITSSPPAGETTTGDVIIRFNSSFIYYQIGRSTIQVQIYNPDTRQFTVIRSVEIDENSAVDAISEIVLNQTNDYFIQLVTSSGNVVTSFRVNRAEPLNTLALIVIIAVSITVVVLTILFIKMRTRMRIR